ncbi:MAG: hypothetical protein NDP13_04600 [Crenarchaeota archaeon]|nr:hypothetical protein [Thermoproteota archaeon]MCR8454252.1 hypothetical protein [Thermoproteota archaeon]MCR8454764.1 hypothetical protein [Thermoproteota archaeon]MCR8462656.1 hypothetical protein [Thermoproteota archaeon]MCR8470275.1 hypothetical protein [Thermoproteota archaeon]
MSSELSNYNLLVIAVSHAIELAKKGEILKAKYTLDAALELADSIEDPKKKSAAFIQLARAYTLIGDSNKSMELLDSIYEELKDKNSTDYALYKLILRSEKVKLGLAQGRDLLDELERIRSDFERLLLESNNRLDILRYYIAFILILWGPEIAKTDIKRVESVLTELVGKYSNLSDDPQYAELLLFLAEIYVTMGETNRAVGELKKALRIYCKFASSGEVEDILNFVKERLPDKFNEILQYLHELGFKK